MKCLCQNGYTGIFCEKLVAKLEGDQIVTDEYTDIPFLCRNINKKADIKKQPIRQVDSPHALNSYYLIQGGQIWYIDGGYESRSYKNQWPKRLAEIFPTIEDNLDAIIFDNMTNEFLLFKVRVNKKKLFKSNHIKNVSSVGGLG